CNRRRKLYATPDRPAGRETGLTVQ
ncbi:hypothetical protein AVEN_210295-1, partial [Araneus ventricosus]